MSRRQAAAVWFMKVWLAVYFVGLSFGTFFALDWWLR